MIKIKFEIPRAHKVGCCIRFLQSFDTFLPVNKMADCYWFDQWGWGGLVVGVIYFWFLLFSQTVSIYEFDVVKVVFEQTTSELGWKSSWFFSTSIESVDHLLDIGYVLHNTFLHFRHCTIEYSVRFIWEIFHCVWMDVSCWHDHPTPFFFSPQIRLGGKFQLSIPVQ